MPTASKLIAETIATFALCFVGAGAICIAQKLGAGAYEGLIGVAMAHGLVLSVAVSATMNISGAHLNPAVTLTMLIMKRIKTTEALGYIVAQLVGAVIAGVLVYSLFNVDVVKATNLGTPTVSEISRMQAILVEAVLTFLLMIAIYGTAVDPRAPRIGGFGIGLAVAANIFIGGPLTGASMNPARTFGPGFVASLQGCMDQFWDEQIIYWIGPIVGAVIGGVLYEKFLLEEPSATTSKPT